MKKLVTLFALFLGCERDRTPADGTLVVHIDTNAPVSTSARVEGRSMPLFDSLRVEVQAPDSQVACPDEPSACLRELAASEEQFRDLSFGIRKTDRKDLSLVVRMFPSTLAGAEIDPLVTVAVSARIVNVPDQGDTHVSLFLDVATVGAGIRAAELSPYTGATSRVGSWAWAKRMPCVGSPKDDEVCIEGGAFWLGAASGALTMQPERSARRVVGLSPYFLLKHEVTVAELRAFLGDHPELRYDVNTWTGALSGSNAGDWCTYTTEVAELDAYPVNCVTDRLARAYCQSRGGDLPTEAQFEYAAGAFNGRPFVWGLEIPDCEHSHFGRRTPLAEILPSTVLSDSSCVGPAPENRDLIGSPAPTVARLRRDVLAVGGGIVRDLAGNLSEWTLDEYEDRGGECWAHAGAANLAIDPVCTQSARGPNLAESTHRYEHSRAVRGGSWLEGVPALASNYRVEQEMGTKAPWVGFRCARPGGAK